MRKIYFVFFLGLLALLGTGSVYGQAFNATYPFTSVTNMTGTTDPTTVPTATGVTFGSFSAVGTPANPNASGRFSFTDWSTGATNGSNSFTGGINTAEYYQVTITPQANFSLDINTITFTLQRSGTGIRQYAVRADVDAYAANLPASINPANPDLSVVPTDIFQVEDASTGAETGSTITLDASFDNITSAVTFRFYGFNAEASGGTFSIDDVTFIGTATFTAPTTNFYSKAAGSLATEATWGTNTDGTGTAPANFTTAGQLFNVVNRTTTTLDANWTVSGAASRVIVGNGASGAELVIPATFAITGTVDVNNLGILTLQNTTLPTLGVLASGSTVNYAQSGAYVVPQGSYQNLTITGGTKTMASGNTTVSGNLVLDGVTDFNGSASPFSTITLSGNLTMQNTAAFAPSPGGSANRLTLTMAGTGTQNITGGNVEVFLFQTVASPSTSLNIVLNSANLLVGNASSASGINLQQATHTLSLNGNTLTIREGANIKTGTGTITGSATSSIVIDKASGSTIGILRFTTGGQTLGTLEYRDLSSGNPLELGTPLSISGSLVQYIGDDIITTSTNLLTLLENATISGPGLGSAYIQGPLARNTNAAGPYRFPLAAVGGQGTTVFVDIQPAQAGNPATFNGQYFETGINTTDPICNADPLIAFQTSRHWIFNRTSGTTPAVLTFEYDGDFTNPTWSNAAPPPDASNSIVMARFNGTCWEAVSSSGVAFDQQASLPTNELSTFSPFTFGYINNASLPVKFANVKAYQQGTGIRVEWSNLTETDVLDYKVERSGDARSFTPLSTLAAMKNDGGRADYSFFDALPVNGVNFYRIQSLEANGQKLYSVIVRVDTRGGKMDIGIYPNPVSNGQLSLQAVDLPKGLYMLRIFNAGGQQVHTQQLNMNGGSVSEMIQLPASLKAGMYHLQLTNAELRFGKSFIIE